MSRPMPEALEREVSIVEAFIKNTRPCGPVLRNDPTPGALRTAILAALDEAVAKERERCAKLCECEEWRLESHGDGEGHAEECARLIRQAPSGGAGGEVSDA